MEVTILWIIFSEKYKTEFPDFMVYHSLVLLEHDDISNAENTISCYLKSVEKYDELIYLYFARYCRKANLLAESKKLFQVLFQEDSLSYAKSFMTKEEITFMKKLKL